MKAPWHKGNYHVRSRKVVADAYADPETRCWRPNCRRTLAEVRRDKRARNPKDTTRVYWCAGHLNRAEVGGTLKPECSECSGREGQRLTALTNRRRNARQPQHTRVATATTIRW